MAKTFFFCSFLTLLFSCGVKSLSQRQVQDIQPTDGTGDVIGSSQTNSSTSSDVIADSSIITNANEDPDAPWLPSDDNMVVVVPADQPLPGNVPASPAVEPPNLDVPQQANPPVAPGSTPEPDSFRLDSPVTANRTECRQKTRTPRRTGLSVDVLHSGAMRSGEIVRVIQRAQYSDGSDFRSLTGHIGGRGVGWADRNDAGDHNGRLVSYHKSTYTTPSIYFCYEGEGPQKLNLTMGGVPFTIDYAGGTALCPSRVPNPVIVESLEIVSNIPASRGIKQFDVLQLIAYANMSDGGRLRLYEINADGIGEGIADIVERASGLEDASKAIKFPIIQRGQNGVEVRYCFADPPTGNKDTPIIFEAFVLKPYLLRGYLKLPWTGD